ncbi:MAG: type IV pilus assembly protein PilM, partial [Gemmatimonadota bacterium]
MIFGFGRSERTVGLDVGSGLLKVAVVDHSSDYPQLEKVGLRPLVADAIVEGEVRDRALVADTIDALFEEEEISQRRVVSSVGGRDVIVKLIQMDRMSEEDAREVIQWEAGQHVPFDIDEVELDFQIVDPEGEGLQMTVLLVAAKRELVEDRIALLETAGLEAGLVDAEPFALHNALEFNHPEAMDGLVGLACVGHDRTALNVMDDGTPVLIRDLAFGTAGLRETLTTEHGLSGDEAESVLRDGNGELSAPIRQTIHERAQKLAQGVERASVFLETQDYGAGLGALYLCGGVARVPGVAELLADRLGVDVKMANPV